MPSKRNLSKRVDALAENTESDGPRELGWFDLLKHAEHCNQLSEDEEAPTYEEHFGEPVYVADWIENLGDDSEDSA